MTRTWKEVSPYTGSGIEEDAPANAAGGGNRRSSCMTVLIWPACSFAMGLLLQWK